MKKILPLEDPKLRNMLSLGGKIIGVDGNYLGGRKYLY